MRQHANHSSRKTALWKDRCALHVKDNILALDILFDTILGCVVKHVISP